MRILVFLCGRAASRLKSTPADIIGTVAIRPSLDELYVLGLMVPIRTFLSFALAIEISGTLPWRQGEEKG